MKTVHQETTGYYCGICGKDFYTRIVKLQNARYNPWKSAEMPMCGPCQNEHDTWLKPFVTIYTEEHCHYADSEDNETRCPKDEYLTYVEYFDIWPDEFEIADGKSIYDLASERIASELGHVEMPTSSGVNDRVWFIGPCNSHSMESCCCEQQTAHLAGFPDEAMARVAKLLKAA